MSFPFQPLLSTLLLDSPVVDPILYLNVKSFGAKGDGVTDDTVAIQTGIDAAGAQGRPLFLPPGVYMVSENTNLPWCLTTNTTRVFTADNATTAIFSLTAHGYKTGDGPFFVMNSLSYRDLPVGLSPFTKYWIIKIAANTFYLATSYEKAIAGSHLSISTTGTGGAHKIYAASVRMIGSGEGRTVIKATGAMRGSVSVIMVGFSEICAYDSYIGDMTLDGNKSGQYAALLLAQPLTNARVSVHCNTTIRNATAGVLGPASGKNATTISFVGDGTGTGTLDESGFPDIVFHFQSGHTTNADFETHVAASTHLVVSIASITPTTMLSDTPATPAQSDAFPAINLFNEEHRHGLSNQCSQRLLIERVTSQNFTGDGFYLAGGSNDARAITVESTYRSCTATLNERSGITLGGTSYRPRFEMCRFLACGAQQVDFESFTDPLGIPHTIYDPVFVGCTIDAQDVTDNFIMTPSLTHGASIVGCTLNGPIRLGVAENVSFVGCNGINPTFRPFIQCYGSTFGISVLGGSYHSSNVYNAAAQPVIEVLGPSSVTVTGAKIQQDAQGGHAFNFEGDVGSLTVSNCDLVGPGTLSITGTGVNVRADAQGTAIKSLQVLGNRIKNFGYAGVRVTGITGSITFVGMAGMFTVPAGTIHKFETGYGPIQLTSTGTLPTGFSLATNYWAIRINATKFYLADSRADAMAGAKLSVSDDGSPGAIHTYHSNGRLEELNISNNVFNDDSKTNAFIDLRPLTTNCDSLIEALEPGTIGNSTTIEFVHNAGAVATGVLDESLFPFAIKYTFRGGTTTVSDFESALAKGVNVSLKTRRSWLDLSTVSINCNSVVMAGVPGLPGDSEQIRFVATTDAAKLVSGNNPDGSGQHMTTYYFQDGVTTVAQFEASLSTSKFLTLKTAGSPGNVLHMTVDEFALTNLAHGVANLTATLANPGDVFGPTALAGGNNTPAMTIGIALDADMLGALQNSTIVGNANIGGCVTPISQYPAVGNWYSTGAVVLVGGTRGSAGATYSCSGTPEGQITSVPGAIALRRGTTGPGIMYRKLFGYDSTGNVFVPATALTSETAGIDASKGMFKTLTPHGFANGDGPFRFSTTGGLPPPMTTGIDFWIIVVDANVFQIAISRAFALAKTPYVISTRGSGVHTLLRTGWTAIPMPAFARGLITCVAKTNITVGFTDAMTISDGINPTTTYYFDTVGAGGGTGVKVDLSAVVVDAPAPQVAARLRTAILANQPVLTVTDNADGTLTVVHKIAGTFANIDMTEAVNNPGFLVTGMSGGVDP